LIQSDETSAQKIGCRQTAHDRFFKKVFGRGNVAAELLRCYLPPEIVSAAATRRRK